MLDQITLNDILKAQRNEITEHHIYKRLARVIKDEHNKGVLARISGDELRHYHFCKEHSGKDVKPNQWMIFKFYWIARVFGITFGIKLMERGEGRAHKNYEKIAHKLPAARALSKDEDEHEKELIALIDEERLKYVGAMVLGLNDALVELTGALAGFTLALANNRLIAMTGMILGIAASLSMASSQYLAVKTGDSDQSPLKSSLYTGGAYFIAVILLILPYLLTSHIYAALACSLGIAVIIIYIFTFYISVAKDIPFWTRFLEMVGISLVVASFTFGLGYVVKQLFGISI